MLGPIRLQACSLQHPRQRSPERRRPRTCPTALRVELQSMDQSPPNQMALVDCAERDAELVDSSEIGFGRGSADRGENARHSLFLHEDHADPGRYVTCERAYLRGRLCRSWRRQSARRERHSQRCKSANIDHRNPSTRRVARQRLSEWTCEGSSTCPPPSLRRVLPSRQGKNEALVVEGNRQKVPVSDLSQPTLTIVLRVLRPARALQRGWSHGAAR